ncbi:DUF5688 family protein [Faecalicatena contorta]|uniref:Uncharacterized protein n=1 Tax=Faecalicatena contorta TaxID=39482 RepID=A0A315ZQV3_9FIRM|nr:DUF5688 family protein [Faecalicatena contorta]PWJ47652.1 hypothetical protein A8805_11722 [Faecalicatena contorta]SUQ15845.1 hypothetical protein SAMN05216529_11722 [Faecalicatena contorta]
MKYQEFLYAVEEELNKKLKEGVKASVYTAQKNNGREKKGILFQTKELSASPAIYLEGLYTRLQKGEQMDRLVQEILDFYETVGGEEVWDYSQLKEYDKIQDKIIFKLIHTDKNKKMLECIPFVEVLDLSIVFYVLLEMDKTGTATIQISNEHLKMWEVSKEELYDVALKNAANLLPAEFFTMQYAIEKMLEVASGEDENLLNQVGEEKEDVMYVLTNSLRNYGAACLFYPHVLDMIGEMLKEDFFILPSSIHEVIIVPESKGLDTEEMNEMVIEINETQVAPEEVLSNHVYFYKRKGKKLMLSK